MKRGEVWSVALPFIAGHEQGGQRPAIVIQDALYGQRSPLILIVPLTSQSSSLRFPATVQVDPAPLNGLNLPSVALVFQTRAADRSRFVQRLAMLSPDDLNRVLDKLNKLSGQ